MNEGKINSHDVLDFWFGPNYNAENIDESFKQRWWKKDPAFDELIGEKFSKAIDEAIEGKYVEWEETSLGRLALIILLDQFSRNIYRNQAQAFAQDKRAQKITLEGLSLGQDQELGPYERVFFYMPLEHSEDKALQAQCVTLFERLYEEYPTDAFKRFLDFAISHQKIIDRFGRFVHRNALLGRESTKEEELFLLEPGSSF